MAIFAALRAIGRNKLRACLTMLGVFIGVAALIAMVAVGEGARAAVEAQVQSLGTDLLVVLPGTTRVNGVRAGNGSASTLRVATWAAILEEDSAVADVSYVSRQARRSSTATRTGPRACRASRRATSIDPRWPIRAGHNFTDEDNAMEPRVPARPDGLINVFGEFSDPIGATVLVKNVPMTVIGVLAVKGHSASGQDQDDVVLIPFTTSQERVLGVASTRARHRPCRTISSPPSVRHPIRSASPRSWRASCNTIYVQARSHRW
jgi:macrolide transport system ATP-binding/permease protein